MAALITKLAKSSVEDRVTEFYNSNHDREFHGWNLPHVGNDPAIVPPVLLRSSSWAGEKTIPVLSKTTSKETGYAVITATCSSWQKESRTVVDDTSVRRPSEDDILLSERSRLER